jgi:NAD(P)-dependent dehydrogenase (short-subunit alcohol dehydrogenase family)
MSSQRVPTVLGGNTYFQPILDLWFEAGRATAEQALTVVKNGAEACVPEQLRQWWLGEVRPFQENLQHFTAQLAHWYKAAFLPLTTSLDWFRSGVPALRGGDRTVPLARPAPAVPKCETTGPAVESVPRASRPGDMQIQDRVALVTGAASGIGEAVVRELANRGARAVIMVDRSGRVLETAGAINRDIDRAIAHPKVGDTTDEAFRRSVFEEAWATHGCVQILVPAAGITRDALAVKLDKQTCKAEIYPVEKFREVLEVNLVAPIYWSLEMVAWLAEDRLRRGLGRWLPSEGVQGVVVFIGSVSSQGNKGQISYAVSKAGLEGAAATLMKEVIFHGIRCAVIHPGFTNTPMVRALGEEYINKHVLPYTQLRRLIEPQEIADAICFMITNSAVSGELWADAGWHPSA